MNDKIDSEKYPVLAEYTDPVLPPVRDIIGREQEIKDIRAGLLRAELNNILLLGAAGAGKSLSNDTLIPVNDDRLYVPIGKLKYGDEVFDENGNPTKVCGVYPQGELEAWEVEFENGQKVICNDEHMWNVCRVFDDTTGNLCVRSAFKTMTLGELNELRDEFRLFKEQRVRYDSLYSMLSMGFLSGKEESYFSASVSKGVEWKYLDYAVPYGKVYKRNGKVNKITKSQAYLMGAYAAQNEVGFFEGKYKTHYIQRFNKYGEPVKASRSFYIRDDVNETALNHLKECIADILNVSIYDIEFNDAEYECYLGLKYISYGETKNGTKKHVLLRHFLREGAFNMIMESSYDIKCEFLKGFFDFRYCIGVVKFKGRDDKCAMYRGFVFGFYKSDESSVFSSKSEEPVLLGEGLNNFSEFLKSMGFKSVIKTNMDNVIFNPNYIGVDYDSCIYVSILPLNKELLRRMFSDCNASFNFVDMFYTLFEVSEYLKFTDVFFDEQRLYDASKTLIEMHLENEGVKGKGKHGGIDYLKIKSIIKLDKKLPMTCIYVDSPTHLYQCTKNHIVTHNTSLVQQVSVETPQWMFLEIDVSRLISKVHDVKQAGTLLKSLFDEAERYVKQESHELVLFMDEFHQIVNISAAAVEALKPVLAASGARGIRVIAATTFEEFLKYVSENQALVERLQRVNIRQTTDEATRTILKEMAKKYEVDGMISDDIYYRIVDYTNRYVPASSQPRKSILVLDGMIGKHRSEQRNMDFELLVDVLKTAQGVDVAFAVDIYKLKDYLNSRVLSQKFAIDQLCDRLGIVTADLNDPKKPLSSILFSGSTGVIACSAYA